MTEMVGWLLLCCLPALQVKMGFIAFPAAYGMAQSMYGLGLDGLACCFSILDQLHVIASVYDLLARAGFSLHSFVSATACSGIAYVN